MMNILVAPWRFAKTWKKTSIFVIVIAVAIAGFFVFSGGEAEYNFVTVEIGSVVQEVSVTGRVKSAQSVDLAFERGGRVSNVNVRSGDWVSTGAVLVRLDSSELLAQEKREQANIDAAVLNLKQIIASANSNTGDASATIDTLATALNSVINAMIGFTDIQYKYFNKATGSAVKLDQQKDVVLQLIYDEINLGRTEAWYFTALNSGLKKKVADAQRNPNEADIDTLILNTKDALLSGRDALYVVQSVLAGESGGTQSDMDKIKSEISIVLAKISEVSLLKKSISNEDFEIDIARSRLDQAQASLALINTQIEKYSLAAPFSGLVTNIDIKPGQIISTGEFIVTLIGSSRFQIEANVSEADITKISLGDTARVTLDAYGSNEEFFAKVIHIDPAGKIIDGIAVYKVTLQFSESDGRILAGLTADLDILTDQKDNVLYMPSRNVITRDGKKYARIIVDKESTEARFANLAVVTDEKKRVIYEIEVTTGIKGSDGRIEIISGLKVGDRVTRK